MKAKTRALVLSGALVFTFCSGLAAVNGGQPTPMSVVSEDMFKPIDIPASEPSSLQSVLTSYFLGIILPPTTFVETPRDRSYTLPQRPHITLPSVKPKVIVIRPNIKPHVTHHHTFSGSPSVRQAQAYALKLLGSYQYSCLYTMWSKESGWDPTKSNYAGSGAYGIPQALPGSKMAVYGSDWRTNPITQVKWGIHYVNSRYGSACKAWSFWQVHHWY